MIGVEQIMPLLLESCPTFRPAWDAHLAGPYGSTGIYTDASAFVQFLIEEHEKGRGATIASAFAILERIFEEGDDETKTVAALGIIETLQSVADWRPYKAVVFEPFLGPRSRLAWDEVYLFWEGKIPFITLERGPAELKALKEGRGPAKEDI